MRAMLVGAAIMAMASAAEARTGDVEATDSEEIGIELNVGNGAVDGVSGTLRAGGPAAASAPGMLRAPGAPEPVIHFETARLPRDPGEQTEHPDRAYDVALRLVDGTGRTLLVLTEGDALPEGWAPAAPDARPVDAAVIQMAGTAGRRGALRLGAGRDVEQSLLTSQLALLSRVADRPAPAAIGAQAVVYQQGVDSYWKPAFFNGSPFHHTGTATYQYYNSGGWWYFSQVIVKCNHGSCPGDASMTYYKTYWGPVAWGLAYPQECSGPYGFPHVCNNDTLLQQKNVVYNTSYNTWFDSACTYTALWRP